MALLQTSYVLHFLAATLHGAWGRRARVLALRWVIRPLSAALQVRVRACLVVCVWSIAEPV